MAKPYSYDLRQKVIEAITLDGLKKSEASRLFNISRNTIDLWLKRLDETGDFQALPNKPPGNNHKILDWAKFEDFAHANGEKTQEEMAQLWPEAISSEKIMAMVIVKKEKGFMPLKVEKDKDELI